MIQNVEIRKLLQIQSWAQWSEESNLQKLFWKTTAMSVLKGTDEESMRKGNYTMSAFISVLMLCLTWAKVAIISSEKYFLQM